jgi:hypothetical protein
MKRLLLALLIVAFAVAPCRAGALQLSILDGKVSIDAQDVTIGQILTEWARIGKTRIVNVERLSGAPVTLKLDAVPEKQALEIVLRAVPGYIAAPRETFVADASQYETILIMATTTAVAALRPPPASRGGFVPGGSNVTQLRQGPVVFPGMMPSELPDPADAQQADVQQGDIQQNDPALAAAAAAAGLLPVPGQMPGATQMPGAAQIPGAAPTPSGSLVVPGRTPPQSPGATPATPTPSNPWNAPVGTAQPNYTPPPPPPDPQPNVRPRPPVPDK